MKELLSFPEVLPSTTASFKYIQNSPAFLIEQPYFYQGYLDPDQEKIRTNIAFETHHVRASDLRRKVGYLSLQKHGVEICNQPSRFTSHLDTEEGLHAYLNETNLMLKEKLHADTVICYDAKFRKSRPGPAEVTYYDKSYRGSQSAPDDPAWQAHLDNTMEGGKLHVQRHLTDQESDEYLSERWRVQIFNVWRPLYQPVRQAPLAFCDRASIHPLDLVQVENPSSHRIGRVSFLKYNHEQRWYWLSKQDPDEVTFFLSWDSDAGDSSEFVVHGSFQLDASSAGDATRESIETRAIVITRKLSPEP